MDKKRCSNPFECGTQFECRGGFCEPSSECGDNSGNNGCKPIDGRCLAPNDFESELFKPSENLPSCGIGDPNYQPDQKDCLYDCNLFCDEWGKISANLTPDTELKECSIDDACSPCRSCEIDPFVDQDLIDAIEADYKLQIESLIGTDDASRRFDQIISRVDDLLEDKDQRAEKYALDLEALLIRQEQEIIDLETAYLDAVLLLDEREIALQQEMAELDPNAPNYDSEIDRIGRLLQDIDDERQVIADDYIEDQEDLLEAQQEQRNELQEDAQEDIDNIDEELIELFQEIEELEIGAKQRAELRQRQELIDLEQLRDDTLQPFVDANEAIVLENERLEAANEELVEKNEKLQERLDEIDTSTPEGQQAAAEIQFEIDTNQDAFDENEDVIDENLQAFDDNEDTIQEIESNYEDEKDDLEEKHEDELEAYDERG